MYSAENRQTIAADCIKQESIMQIKKTAARRWVCGEKVFEFDGRHPLIMGILNVTPDSFSDGGTHNAPDQAVAWARRMREAGADIIDVGGESTRPGFDETGVSLEEERRRVIPVVERLVKEGFIVSVDTSKPEIMTEVAQLGAHILNDIRGFSQPGAEAAAAATNCGLVVMHRSLTTVSDDVVVQTVERYLAERQQTLEKLGVQRDRICWDPGFGFGKTVEGNYQLLAATERFVASGQPYLMGLSRKSSIGHVTGQKIPADRVAGSVVGALLAVMGGAQIIRVA
ncbi:dihydropteroate synthase [gut metagenome]|uniref:dihydropteroate synthase n=1 Tax=gut metagenome TaxID=749906 RepID=J9GNI3_9ZZZZ